MATKVVMEALSPTMEEGRLISWSKKEGDAVKTGETLAEVETDKAVMELVARGDGILRSIIVAEGKTVDVGTLVAVIAAADEDISAIVVDAPSDTPAAEETPTRSGVPPPAPPPPPPPPAAAAVSPSPPPSGTRLKASPLARKLAEERGVDLEAVRGSGPGGRIVKRDLEAASLVTHTTPGAAGGYEDVPLSQIRKTIATRLARSIGPIPHYFLTVHADMERAWDAREDLNARGDEVRISFNDIIIKAVATALTKHRECNAWWLEDRIRYFDDVHISMAVAVEGGLITPVIRNVQLKSLREIATEARDLARRARDRKLKPEEYTGGTFSISNLGMLDVDHFTAVINPPEAAILAIGRIADEPSLSDGELEVRRKMKMTMSCDHRVIDGATGARFLQTVTQMLENPLAMVW